MSVAVIRIRLLVVVGTPTIVIGTITPTIVIGTITPTIVIGTITPTIVIGTITPAIVPLVGASHNLDPRSVRQVCEALGLDWSKLPGPEGRV
jgi:ABC-type phosphate transport system permease subunit